MNTPKRFLKSPKPSFRCSGNIPSIPLQRAVVGAQTCSRWSPIVQSLEPDRAVVGARSCSQFFLYCTHDLYEAVQAFQEV